MRGSGLHQSSGSSSPNQGKMPRAYASRSRSVERSAPAASNPFGLRNAFVTGGNASRTPNQGIISRSARMRLRTCKRIPFCVSQGWALRRTYAPLRYSRNPSPVSRLSTQPDRGSASPNSARACAIETRRQGISWNSPRTRRTAGVPLAIGQAIRTASFPVAKHGWTRTCWQITYLDNAFALSWCGHLLVIGSHRKPRIRDGSHDARGAGRKVVRARTYPRRYRPRRRPKNPCADSCMRAGHLGYNL